MRNFFFGLLAFFAFCSTSVAQNYAGIARTARGEQTLTHMKAQSLGEVCGVPLIAAPSRLNEHKAGVFASPDVRMHILVSTQLQEVPPLMRAMVAHECAHIDLGHLRARNANRLTASQSHSNELAADCLAVKRLTKQADHEAIDALAGWLMKGRFPISATHPSSSERIAHLHACAK